MKNTRDTAHTKPLPDGTRVEKIECEPGDRHRAGAKAIVLRSLGPIEYEGIAEVYGYFVEWDDLPGVKCFITGTRIRKVKPDA